jgi:hypothetical protein
MSPLWAASGLGVLFVVAVVAAVWRRRRSADRRKAAFRCKIRLAGERDGARAGPRGRAHAHWVHDVLVVEAGLLHRTTRVLPVKTVHGTLDPTVTVTRKRPVVSLRLELDDESTIEITADADRTDVLGGPFLTVHPVLRRTP